MTMTDKLLSRKVTQPALVVIMLAAMTLFAAPSRSAEFDELVKMAAKENTLVFWASTPKEETVRELVKAFNKKFGLNIKVTRVAVSATDVTARLLAEKKAKRHTVDVSIVSEPAIQLLVKSDIIEKTDWQGMFGDRLQGLKEAANNMVEDNKGYGLEFRHLVYGIAYNTKKISAADVPTKWADIADPKWKRKIAVASALSPLTHLAPVIGTDNVIQLAKDLIKNEPIYTNGTVNTVQKVISGEAPIGLVALNTALGEKEKGAPIDMVHPEPVAMVSTQLVFVVKDAPHPNLAKLWTAWFASEGMMQKAMVDEGSIRARAGAPGEFGDYFSKHNLTTRFAETLQDLDNANDIGKDLAKLTGAN
jgi:iron(III) transport system substrate-binding protein